MKYKKVTFKCNPNSEIITDILAFELGNIGYESFILLNKRMEAYIRSDFFSEKEINKIINSFIIDTNIIFEYEDQEEKNWNEEWEKNYFSPIIIDKKCIIRSSFHKIDNNNYDYDIIINPKMSFGTGHHETTLLVINKILSLNLLGAEILDMGCGTGILSILSEKKGASHITAVDIDEWAYNNTKENIGLNNVPLNKIDVIKGGSETIINKKFDYIFANINRNIIIENISHYSSALKNGGIIIMSGFYKEDKEAIQNISKKHNLEYNNFTEKNNWICITFTKK